MVKVQETAEAHRIGRLIHYDLGKGGFRTAVEKKFLSPLALALIQDSALTPYVYRTLLTYRIIGNPVFPTSSLYISLDTPVSACSREIHKAARFASPYGPFHRSSRSFKAVPVLDLER